MFWECNFQNIKDPVLADFNKTTFLTMVNSSIKNSEIGEIVDFVAIDSFLIANEIFASKIFKLYNTRTGELLSNFINKGKGPNEMLFPYKLNYYNTDCFTTFDYNTKELIYFSLDDFRNQNYRYYKKVKVDFSGTQSSVTDAYPLNDNILLCTGFFEKGQYVLYDINSRSTKFFLDYPYDKKHKGESNEIKGTAFQGKISIKPDRKKIINVTGAVLEICEMDNNNEIKRIFRKVYYFPVYKVIQNHAAFDSSQPYAFNSISSTNSYIYMVYSGRSMHDFGEEYYAGNNLLVFDWEGKPVIRFVLDRYIKCFTLDKITMKIYGYSTNPSTGEPEIVTYQLPEIKR